MSDNHTKPKLKARHGANSSLNDMNLSLGDRHSQATKHELNSKARFSVVTPVITHFFMKQAVATDDSKRYYIDLSKEHASGMPSRYLLAFFMPDNSPASQAVTIYSGIAPQAHLSASRGQTIISIANHLLTDYDGLTLQNKIAVRRICRAVACVTESKTRHPILLSYSVAFTQKTTQGVIHHG